jgi:hypothetical protein
MPTGSMAVEEMFHLVHIESAVKVDISVRKHALSTSSICVWGRSTMRNSNPDDEIDWKLTTWGRDDKREPLGTT